MSTLTVTAWPTADALPAVLELARTAKSPVIKILALRGYIRLALEAGEA